MQQKNAKYYIERMVRCLEVARRLNDPEVVQDLRELASRFATLAIAHGADDATLKKAKAGVAE